jgi:hypothetical protein
MGFYLFAEYANCLFLYFFFVVLFFGWFGYSIPWNELGSRELGRKLGLY